MVLLSLTKGRTLSIIQLHDPVLPIQCNIAVTVRNLCLTPHTPLSHTCSAQSLTSAFCC